MTQSSYVKASLHVGLNYTQGRPQLCSSEAYIYSFRSKAGEGEKIENSLELLEFHKIPTLIWQ